ncbi:unnamed protein product, partial [Urochloa humidicola]
PWFGRFPVVASSKPVGTLPSAVSELLLISTTPNSPAACQQPFIPTSTKHHQIQTHRPAEDNPSKMERMSSSVQSWVEEHKLATIGGVWAAAVGTSVAYSRRRAPQRATSLRLIHARLHAQALTLAVLGGAAAFMHYRSNNKSAEQLDLDFYSQLPAATDADGNENERWSW